MPNSTVSSYELMFKSDLNIGFSSTVSIEALYFDRPVIELGPRIQNIIPFPNYVSDKKALLDILGGNIPHNDSKIGAEMFAVYRSKRGFDCDSMAYFSELKQRMPLFEKFSYLYWKLIQRVVFKLLSKKN